MITLGMGRKWRKWLGRDPEASNALVRFCFLSRVVDTGIFVYCSSYNQDILFVHIKYFLVKSNFKIFSTQMITLCCSPRALGGWLSWIQQLSWIIWDITGLFSVWVPYDLVNWVILLNLSTPNHDVYPINLSWDLLNTSWWLQLL